MNTTTTETFRVGLYNGKKFKVLFAGTTKHGDRAKLCWFSDEDKSFWVDLAKVEITENAPPKKTAAAPKAGKHCASCTCQQHKPAPMPVEQVFHDEGSEEQFDGEPTVEDMIAAEEGSLFGHAAPVSKPVGHKVGKGSLVCACGAKKKPQFATCYGCFQTH